MEIISETVDRNVVPEGEVRIVSLARVEGSQDLGNRLVAVAQVPSFSDCNIATGIGECCLNLFALRHRRGS